MDIGDHYLYVYNNRIEIVSDDFTGLNRDIHYAQFVDRGKRRVTKQQIINDVSNLHYTFAIWGFDEVGYTKI